MFMRLTCVFLAHLRTKKNASRFEEITDETAKTNKIKQYFSGNYCKTGNQKYKIR